MPATKTIEIKSLAIGYPGRKGAKVVAGHIHADINNGELTCLLGANGMGKSTLLRTLSAFQPKLSGEIRILGKAIETYTEKQLSRIIGVVLTDRPDIRNMTAEELIGLGRSPYTGFWGGLRKKDKKIVADAIALIKIEDLAHRMVQTLSDGERQKVMIAKALVQETPVVFLDEPTAFLDFPSKVEIMQLLHRLSRETGKTIFLSTHDLELALQIADKLWIMDKAHGVTVGTPEDLSLNGSLDHAFARKGISFDMETGLFRVDNTLTKEIRLIGDGRKYAMVRKALQRNGIKADPDIRSDVYIEVKEHAPDYHYILHTPQEGITKTASIEALLDAVKHILLHFS
jgi:iron complex transport system ATP-binding protein